MKLTGERWLNASPEKVWQALNDPAILQQCIPGCESLQANEQGASNVGANDVGANDAGTDAAQETASEAYRLRMAVKVGPVAAKFNGKVAIQDAVAPEHYVLVFEGQGGVAGFGKGRAQVQLQPHEGGTTMRYDADAQVGGKIAQVGQRLIDGVAASMAEQFFARFESLVSPTGTAPQADTSGLESETHKLGGSSAPEGAVQQLPQQPPRRTTVPVTVWIMLGLALLVVAYFVKIGHR